MKLELRGVRMNKCVMENNMGPNMKLNVKITTNSQIKLPKEFRKGSVGTVISRIMVGSPMEPLYLFLEQVTNYVDVEASEGTCESSETMMSLFKTICVPMALVELQKNLDQLCQAYHIPPIKLQNNPQAANNNGFLN